MFRDFIDGVFSYIQTLPLLRKYNLYPYLLLGGVISLLLGLLIFGLAYIYSDDLGSFIFSWWPWETGAEWISNISAWVGGAVIILLSLILYKYLIIIVLGPFMSPLSEKIEARISNSSFQQDFSLKRILHEALRGVRIALRNIVREIFYSLILLILSFVPVVGIITAPALFMVQAYYAGFGNMDYYLERHFNVQGSAAFVRRYKGLAIGNGAIFLLLLMIPILGLFVAPVLATISSTVESHKRIADWD